MANQEHVAILRQGVEDWNIWRKIHSEIKPDLGKINLYSIDNTYFYAANFSNTYLSGAIFGDAYLKDADLSRASLVQTNLCGANLEKANLYGADLRGAKLSGAHLNGADLRYVDLERADLSGANLSEATIGPANLKEADLSVANLSEATLIGVGLEYAKLYRTNLTRAVIEDCRIHGISAWDVQLEGAKQLDLRITPFGQPKVTVDNLEVAQFIYLLLSTHKIREVINTIGQKGVLILGRFTPERKAVLDAIREKLRTLNFLPIVFDFERPTARDFTETILTLAGLSCFIIADITNPKSSPLELQATVPNYMIPFVPIIQEGEQPFAMFTDLQNRYHDWVLDTLRYDTPSNLVKVLEQAIVRPALERQAELLLIKAQDLRTRHIKDYL